MTLLTDAVWVWADAAIEDLVTTCTVALTDDAAVSGISGGLAQTAHQHKQLRIALRLLLVLAGQSLVASSTTPEP